MCSVQEEGETQLPRKKGKVGRKCMKCEERAVAIARTKDPFCKSCFNAYITHRFRATIGKSRLIRDGEKALLAFSGGISSRVMLALVEEGLSQRVHKKLRFIPTVIYIDEGAILGLEWSERCRHSAEVIDVAIEVGLPVYFTQLEQVFGCCEVYHVDDLPKHCHQDTNSSLMKDNMLSYDQAERPAKVEHEPQGRTRTSPLQELESAETKIQQSPRIEDAASLESGAVRITKHEKCSFDELHLKLESFLEKRDTTLEIKLKKLFDAAQTKTAKENILLSLRHRLLSEIARKHEYTKVLVGDNATRLAVRLLGNVAQGRGASLPLDTGFADARCDDVIIARPLREFPSREVAMHMALNDLKTVTVPSLSTADLDKTSLEQLTESFIAGLQADFPSTVNTIFRTGDKLQVNTDSALADRHSCSLCQAPLDEFDDVAVFTHLKRPTETSSTLWGSLCYGCRLTVKDVKNGSSLLPPFVNTTGDAPDIPQHSTDRQSMRKQVQEYLLDDS